MTRVLNSVGRRHRLAVLVAGPLLALGLGGCVTEGYAAQGAPYPLGAPGVQQAQYYQGYPPRGGWDGRARAECREARRDAREAARDVQRERREAWREQAYARDPWEARREGREARREVGEAQRDAARARARADWAC